MLNENIKMVRQSKGLSQEELAAKITACGGTAIPFDSVADAVGTAAREGEIVLAVGSLYMAGEVHEAFRRVQG